MSFSRNIISTFMSIVLAVGLCPLPAWAQETNLESQNPATEYASGESALDTDSPSEAMSDTSSPSEGALNAQESSADLSTTSASETSVPLEKSFAAQLAEQANADESADTGSPNANAQLIETSYDDDDIVTLIVRLEGDDASPVNSTSDDEAAHALSAQSTDDTRAEVKAQITNLINGRSTDEAAPWWQAIPFLAPQSTVELDVKYDYTTLIQAFAVNVPYRYVADIQKLPGVANAFIEHTYTQSATAVGVQSDVYNIHSLRMVGADSSEYTGTGIVAAVIDSGVDTSHGAFAPLASGYALDASTVASRVAAAQSAGRTFHGTGYKYVSSKFPFSYDYADNDDEAIPSSSINEHGTHVAGIIGANNGGIIQGVAPDVQIVPMKVAGDLLGTITDSDIIAALEDAVNLDVDTINMSLGSDAGFPEDNDEEYQLVYESVKASGIMLNVAAGNADSAAAYNNSGSDLPYVTDPDDSIVAAPSTYDASVSVASVNATATLPYLTIAGDADTHILCQPSSLGGTAFADLNGSFELYDAGYGQSDKYTTTTAPGSSTATEDARGKIALIQRGDIDDDGNAFTFEKKVSIAADHGAVAAIVYNNIADDESLITMTITDEDRIPAVFVSNADGLKLAAAAQAKKQVAVASDQVQTTDGMVMSSFSSMGVNADMDLKPEITAPGGNIYSSVLENAYSTMSGTSMATPHMTGLTADVAQYLKAKGLASSKADLHRLANALLMSTATPIADTENGRTGTYYTPRKQGAGLANVAHATASAAYLSVPDSYLPKGNLGDSTDGKWSFAFTVNNLTGNQLVYGLDAAALSAEIQDGLFSHHSKNYAGQGISVSFSGSAVQDDQVTVPANGTATVTVSISTDATFASAVSAATAGTFVDGFVMLDAVSGATVDLSLPYVAFYGDWSTPRIFDSVEGDGTSAHIRTTYPYHANTSTELGLNPLNTTNTRVDVGKYTVAPYSYLQRCSVMTTATSLLRSAKRLTYTVTPKNSSTVVKEHSYSNVQKSYMYTSSGIVTYAEAFLGTQPTFDGTDESGSVLPAGWYTETIQGCVMDGDDTPDDAISFDFYLDTQAPEVTDTRIVETKEWDDESLTWKTVKTIRVSVTDAGFIAGVQLATTNSYAASGVNLAPTSFQVMDADHEKSTAVFEFDYDDVMDKLSQASGANQNKVVAHVYDYGLNFSEEDIILQDSYPTGITIEPATASLMVGQSAQLDGILEGEDLTATRVTWESSDEDVATVDASGLVKAVAEGSTTITARAEAPAGQTAPSATAQVTVTPISDEAGIVLDFDSLETVEGADFTLSATLASSLSGSTISWDIDNPSIVRQTAVTNLTSSFRALKAGTATISATAAGKTASCTVKVSAANASDFVIDENGVLIDYIGSSVDVVIPSNVTAIGTRSNYDGSYTPGDDDNPVEAVGVFQGLPIETVVIPESVESIGDYAFDDCQRLRHVEIKEGSKLKTIGRNAFSSAYKLSTIELPDTVEAIGQSAFYYTGLLEFTVPPKVTELSDYVLAYNTGMSKLTVKGKLTRIGDGALMITSALSKMTPLNEGISTIGDAAFEGCGLASILLPSTVKSIGKHAFMSAAASSITLNEGLESIGLGAFYDAGVTELSIPDSVTSVGSNLASYATNLQSLHIGKLANKLETPLIDTISLVDITVDGDNPYMSVESAYGCLCDKAKTEIIAYPLGRKDASIAIPAGIETIDDYAFCDSPSLTSLSFCAELKEIGANAFRATGITGIGNTQNLETIDSSAFANCASLSSVSLDHVKTLGSYCFAYDSALTTISLGDALVTIGSAALIDTSVREVSLPDTCTAIGESAWSNNASLKKVHLGAGLVSMPGGTFTNCFGLKEITVSSGNTRFFSEENAVLYERDAEDPSKLTVKVCAIEANLKNYAVAAGTVRIDDFAFARCASLKSLTLPEGLKELGTSALNGCTNLAALNLPDGLEVIGAFALSGIDELFTLDVPASIREIDEYSFAFSEFRYLVLRGASADLYVPGYLDNLRSLYIGPGFKGIDWFAFAESSRLKTVVVNANVTDIDEDVFDNAVATAFYVNPAYPDAYAAVEALDFGTVQDYIPLDMRYSVSPIELTAGSPATIEASSIGGAGSAEYRFVPAGSSEAGNWSSSATYTLAELPSTGQTIEVSVRDSTRLTHTANVTLSPGYAVGTYAADITLRDGNGADAPLSPLDALIESTATVTLQNSGAGTGAAASVDIALSDLGAESVQDIAVSGGTAVTPAEGADGRLHVSLGATDFNGTLPLSIATKFGNATATAVIDMTSAAPAALKSALVKSIESTATLNGARYTTASWNALTSALDAALDVNADPKASQTTVNSAASALDTALDNLERNDVDYSWNAGDAGTYNVRVGFREKLWSSNCENYQSLVSKQAQLVRASNKALKLRLTIMPTQLGPNDYSTGGYVTAQDLYETPHLDSSYGTLVEENIAEGWATYEFSLASLSAKPVLYLYYYPIIYQEQTLEISVKTETIASPHDEEAADKTELVTAYNKAAALDLDSYLDGSAKDSFIDALSTAKSALKFKSVAQEDADAALDALVIALRSLVAAGDTETLAAVADSAEAYCTGNYSQATIEALKEAIADARSDAKLSPGAEEAGSYAQAVVKAFVELAPTADDAGAIAAARADLNAALAATGSLESGNAAKTAAESVAADSNATTAEIIAATSALESAVQAANDAADSSNTRAALSAAVKLASALEQGSKAASAYTELRAAVMTAAQAADNPLQDADALSAALATLQTAITAFNGSHDIANTVELGYAIEKAQAILDSGTGKTAAARASLTDTIGTAQALVESANADGSAVTQAQVDAQAKALESTCTTFADSVEQSTLTSLTSLIENVSSTPRSNKIESAWTALQDAVSTAEAARDDASLTEADGQQAIADLRAAATAFGQAATVGDKTQLAAAIAQGDTITQGTKTNAAWNQFGAALASAKAVNANGDATQQQVDAATANLLAAIETFANAEDRATAELSAAIATAEALPQASFTDSTWTTLQSVLSASKATLANAQSSDEALATALENLQVALENLILADTGVHTIPITYLQHNSDAISEAASYLKSTATIASDDNGGFKLTISVNPGYERYNIRFSDESTGAEDKVFPHENAYDFTMPIASMFSKSSAWVHLNPIYEMHHQFDIVLDPTGLVSETPDTLGLISGRVYTATSDIWNATEDKQSMAAGFFEPTVELVKMSGGSYYAMLTATESGKGFNVRLADADDNFLEVISESPLVFKVPIADPLQKTRIVFYYNTTAISSTDSALATAAVDAQAADRQVADLYFPNLSAATVSVEAVDKTGLSSAITDARAIELGAKTEDAFTALASAIEEAQDLVDRSDATQAEVNAEIVKLSTATEAFNASPGREGDKTVLNSVIKGAQASLDTTATSVDGSDIASSQTWTTAEIRSVLQTAIADAQQAAADASADQAAIDEAARTLAEAHAAFDSARKAGTKPNASSTPAVQRVTMLRLYNPNSGEHFYTSSTSEHDALVTAGWKAEGTGWIAPSASNTPVFRLYNKYAGDHHYTTSGSERDSLMKAGWQYEGIGWYSDDAQGQPLHRLYNPNATTGSHHYTTSTDERDSLVKLGWKSEGVSWYGLN